MSDDKTKPKKPIKEVELKGFSAIDQFLSIGQRPRKSTKVIVVSCLRNIKPHQIN